MNKQTIRNATFIALALCLCALLCIMTLVSLYQPIGTAIAKGDSGIYFYDQLSDLSKKFYDALGEMHANGSFKNGKCEYDLVENGVLTQSDISGYVSDGKIDVPVAFGSARDAYYMDHPELFYTDIFKVSVNAGRQGEGYIAYLGNGRLSSFYADGFNNVNDVNTAIQAFEEKIDGIVNTAKALPSSKEQIEFVNEWLTNSDNVVYDQDLYDNRDGGVNASAFSFTAYGALVNGRAVCSGYSRAFKVIMDKLGIPCVLVSGYGVSKTGYANHEWNYVQLDGKYYAVDTTWNSADEKSTTKYLLTGNEVLKYDHINDGVVSTSGFELKYPDLASHNYGETEDGLVYEKNYHKNGEITTLTITFSYNDKGARKLLEEDGLNMIVRMCYDTDADVWSPWTEFSYCQTLFNEGVFTDVGAENCSISVGAQVQGVQVAITPNAPDALFSPLDSEKHAYDSSSLFVTFISDVFENDAYGSYVIPPSPTNQTLPSTGVLPVDKEYEISTQYTEELKLIDENQPVGIKVTSAHDNIEEFVTVRDVAWDSETQTLSFKFKPSEQYLHNYEDYNIVPTNLISTKQNGKTPKPMTYTFGRMSALCPRVLGGGRLYMQLYGQPSIVSTQDLSMDNFQYTDENGETKYYSQNQVSQLMLVVSDVPSAKQEVMQETLNGAKDELGLSDEALQNAQSATYEINLQLCAKTAEFVKSKQSTNSVMQVGIGFPGGKYDENKVYKVYHYTHDKDGNITGVEEVPVVLNACGIVAMVESFSPFMVVAFDKDTVTSKKSIMAMAVGEGGYIEDALVNDSPVYTDSQNTVRLSPTSVYALENNDKITYSIKCENGYKINKVMFNGADLTDKVSNGKLILNANDVMEGGIVEVTFIDEEVAQQNETLGRELIEPTIVVSHDQIQQPDAVQPEVPTTPENPTEPSNGNSVGMLVGICVGIVAVALIVLVAVIIVSKKKKNTKA